MLCNLCQNVQFKSYLDLTREEKFYLLSYCEEWLSDDPNDYSEEEVLNNDLGLVGGPHESFYFHHRDLESLRKAADSGCNFCYRIFYGLLQTTEINHSIENSYDRFYFVLQTPDIHDQEEESLYHGDLTIRFGEECLGGLRLKDLNHFEKFATRSQDIEDNLSTGSSKNLDLAASWLHDCANYHEHCCHQPHLESILPYRVLDLEGKGNPQHIFLSIGEDRVGSYAALSYCWGKLGSQDNYVTTMKNLELRQEAVDISNFPKTFTDAIVVCRYLGIRFLWIDSLCIVQGNRSDWQTQSKRMGDIYANAALTISAAVGEDSFAGLFIDRDFRTTYPCMLDVQYPKEDGVIQKGAFLMCSDWYTPEPAYLDTRGWTYQEKYLSPRTLSFSKTEMYWTCASKTASEGLPMGLIPLNHKSDFDRFIKADANGNFPAQIDKSQRFHWWYQTVEIYSYRILTYETDRLMALTGLASKFQTPDDEFLYGLWKSDMARGLAWRLSAENKETATDTSLTSSTPSWSWASCPGKVITYSDPFYENDGTVIECNDSICVSGNGPSVSTTFFEVLSVGPMTPATDLASSFTRPSLKLQGLVLEIIPAESCAAYSEPVFRACKSFILFRYAFLGTCEQHFLTHAFYDQPVTKGERLYCLPLTLLPLYEDKDAKKNTRELFEGHSIDEWASIQSLILDIGKGKHALPNMTWCAGPVSCRGMKENDAFSCLILKRVDAGVKFRRVGYLELHNHGRAFDGVPPTTLEII